MSLVSMQPTRLNTKDPLLISQTPTNPYTLELHLAIKEVLPSSTPASSDPSLKVIMSGSREPTDNMEELKVHGKEFLNIGFLVDTLRSVKSLVTDNCIIIIILKLIKLLSL